MLFFGRSAQRVQAQRLGGFGQLVQVVVQQVHKGREFAARAFGRPGHVAVDVLFLHGGQQIGLDFFFDHTVVLRQPRVQQVVHAGQRIVQPSGFERRRLVADDDGTAPALGLLRLADVVGNVGVGHGHVAHGQHAGVKHRQAALFAGQPFLAAVGAKVHQRIAGLLLARPQVGGQVVVRGPGAGRVVNRLFLGLPFLPPGRLRQDGDLAQHEARHHEHGLPALIQNHGRRLGLAPALAQLRLHGGGLLAQPGAVARHGHGGGQAVAQQGFQLAHAVGRGQQALELGDEFGLGRHFGVVARRLQSSQGGLQAARHVQKGRRQVLLTRRIVPEEHRQAFVGICFALQRHQAQRLAHHGVGLRRDGGNGRIARAAGRGDLDVGHARVFGLRQVKGHVHQRHALGVGLPVGGVAAPVGHGLQHGQP